MSRLPALLLPWTWPCSSPLLHSQPPLISAARMARCVDQRPSSCTSLVETLQLPFICLHKCFYFILWRLVCASGMESTVTHCVYRVLCSCRLQNCSCSGQWCPSTSRNTRSQQTPGALARALLGSAHCAWPERRTGLLSTPVRRRWSTAAHRP